MKKEDVISKLVDYGLEIEEINQLSCVEMVEIVANLEQISAYESVKIFIDNMNSVTPIDIEQFKNLDLSNFEMPK